MSEAPAEHTPAPTEEAPQPEAGDIGSDAAEEEEEVLEEVVEEVEPGADTETDDLASSDHGDVVSEFKDEDTPMYSPPAPVEEDIELGTNGTSGDAVDAEGEGMMKPHKVGFQGQALEDRRRIKALSVMCACLCVAALAVGLPFFIPFVLDLPPIIAEE